MDAGVISIGVLGGAALTVVVVEPTACDAVALSIAATCALVCWLMTHNAATDAYTRAGWAILTVTIGAAMPRALCNRGIIHDSYADFILASVVTSMLVPLLLVALWKALGNRAPKIADNLIDKIHPN